MSLDYYDRQGKPLTMEQWGKLHSDYKYKLVAAHWTGGWMTSTIWLGLNHNWNDNQPPLIFETMIFSPERARGRYEEFCDRYSTLESARLGHEEALLMTRALSAEDPAPPEVSEVLSRSARTVLAPLLARYPSARETDFDQARMRWLEGRCPCCGAEVAPCPFTDVPAAAIAEGVLI